MAMGLFQILKEAFTAVPTFDDLNDEFYDGLEEALILADMGVESATDAVAKLRKKVKERLLTRADEVKDALRAILAEKLEKDGKGGILGNVLAGNTNMAVSMARTLLNTMPQEKKDELVVQLVTKNRDKLLQKGGELAAKNGVRLRLCDIAAKKL